MLVSVSRIVVLLFGVVVGALSLWGMVAPRRLLGMVLGVMTGGSGMYAAVGARILLGVALLLAAPVSTLPTTFFVLGWVALLAAAILPLVGAPRIAALVRWLETRPAMLVRLWLVFGLAFGVVLVYGALGR